MTGYADQRGHDVAWMTAEEREEVGRRLAALREEIRQAAARATGYGALSDGQQALIDAAAAGDWAPWFGPRTACGSETAEEPVAFDEDRAQAMIGDLADFVGASKAKAAPAARASLTELAELLGLDPCTE